VPTLVQADRIETSAFPRRVSDTRLSIELVEAAASRAAERTERQRLFKITDASGDLECLTEWLEVKENVRL
jgi:hypothetical protein